MITTPPAAVALKTRLQVIGASVICFVVACTTPALELTGKRHEYMSGVEALLTGPLFLLIGQFAWLANLFWLLALLFVFLNRWRASVVTSLLAVLVGSHAWALLGREIPDDEGFATKVYLKTFHIGFYLWLLSFFILAAGSLIASKRRYKL